MKKVLSIFVALSIIISVTMNGITVFADNTTQQNKDDAVSIYNNFIKQDPQIFLSGEKYLKNNFYPAPTDEQVTFVRNTALDITKNAVTTADKIFAVCKYVSENTYYDFDFIDGKKSSYYVIPYDVLTYGITVCQGYSTACKALLQMLNIPCVEVDSMLNGMGHAFNCAYDGSRWILFDSTWCSNNSYRNSTKIKGVSKYDQWYDFTVAYANTETYYHVFTGMEYTQAFGELRSYPSNITNTDIVIQDGVTSIARQAFIWRDDLTSMTFPNSLAYIGSGAFLACTNLKTLYFYGNAPSVATDAFQSASVNLSIFHVVGATGFGSTWNGYQVYTFSPQITPTPTAAPTATPTVTPTVTPTPTPTVTPTPTPAVVRVKSVKLNRTTLTLKKGKTYRLIATINPSNSANKRVTWKSGSKAIATVTYKGLVKANRKGSVNIYVYTVDGKKTAKCRVTAK